MSGINCDENTEKAQRLTESDRVLIGAIVGVGVGIFILVLGTAAITYYFYRKRLLANEQHNAKVFVTATQTQPQKGSSDLLEVAIDDNKIISS